MGVGSAVLQPPSALHCAVATAPSSPAWSLCPQSGASVCTSTTAHAELPREPEHGLPGGSEVCGELEGFLMGAGKIGAVDLDLRLSPVV